MRGLVPSRGGSEKREVALSTVAITITFEGRVSFTIHSLKDWSGSGPCISKRVGDLAIKTADPAESIAVCLILFSPMLTRESFC